MDARAVALALALPLTARAAALPSRMYPAAPPPPPPGLQPASAGRDVVARACSLAALSPAREVLREHLRTGAAAEARGRALALATRGLGFHTDGRTLAARGLGFHTDGRTLAARGLGFHTDDRSVALSFPITSGALTSSNDGLAVVLAFPMDAPPPGTTALAAAQDARGQGLQVCLRRGLSMVCHAYPRGTASSRAPTLLQPSCDRSRPMLRPSLPMPMHFPRTSARTVSHVYVNRCTVQTNGTVTDKKTEEPKWKRKLHISLGYLIVAAKAKFKFHTAVGCVVVAAKIAVLAGVIQKSEFISSRVKLPKKVVAAAAMSLLFGKSLYSTIKETKEFSELVLYFIALYKESVDSSIADRNKDTGASSDTNANSDAGVPSEASAPSDTGGASATIGASDTGRASVTGNASETSAD